MCSFTRQLPASESHCFHGLGRSWKRLGNTIPQNNWMVLLLHAHYWTIAVVIHIGCPALCGRVGYSANFFAPVSCQCQTLVYRTEPPGLLELRQIHKGITKVIASLEVDGQIEEIISTTKSPSIKISHESHSVKSYWNVAQHQCNSIIGLVVSGVRPHLLVNRRDHTPRHFRFQLTLLENV